MATKTQVVDGAATVTGTLRVQNQSVHPILISAPTAAINVVAGGVECIIEDVSLGWGGPLPNPSAPPGTVLIFAAYIRLQDLSIPAHQFYYVSGASDDDVELDFSISVTGRRLWRTESHSPSGGRDASPAYAKDVTETDSWVIEDPVSWDVTFGSMTSSGTVSSPPAVAEASPITTVAHRIDQHKGNAGVIYAMVSNLEWDEAPINYVRYEYPSPKPASGVYLDGKAGGFEVETVSNSSLLRVVSISRPLIVDFSKFGVWNRDGVLENPRVSGGFVANNHVPDSLNWSTENGAASPGDIVYPTVAELRAVGTWVQTAGLVTNLSYRDPDDQYDLLSGASRSFSITEASAREQGYDDTDLSIVLRVPPIDKVGCDEDCDFVGVTLTRRDDVGIYGPAPALDNSDWTGSGEVGSATVGGVFVVSGSTGSLLLTIPSGYQDRLDEVPLGTAPAGCPTIYLYHRADVWAGEPDEGVYDWRGWELLDIPITAPSADSITVSLKYRTYVHTDNHASGSTRIANYSYVVTEHTVEYAVDVDAGAQTIELPLIAKDPSPVLERVVSITLSGFVSGNWTIGEPKLAQASPAQSIIKTFEYDYQHGGMSGHFDAAYVWYDADEDNGGRDNRSEKTVRFFDYVVGEGSGLDLTTAFILEAYADLVNNVSEVFDASRNDAGYLAAVRDGESPPNTLSSCWGFNICYPDADDPNDEPLEQNSSLGNCAIRCGTWVMVSATKYRMVTDKIVDGRAHGSLISGSAFSRNQTGFSKLWRQSPVDSSWELVETLNTDAHGHWTSESLPEFYDYQGDTGRRWRYGVGLDAGSLAYIGDSGHAYVREYIAGLVVVVGADSCCFDQIPHFLYIFYEDGGAKHVYSAPPDRWFETSVDQTHYALPRADTVAGDSSFSGYVGPNGEIRFYLVRSNVIIMLRSDDWGRNFTEMSTGIAADEAYVFPSVDGSVQHAIYVDGTTLKHALSSDDFATVLETVTIATGVDVNKPCGYPKGNDVFAFMVNGGELTCWKGEERGRVWSEV